MRYLDLTLRSPAENLALDEALLDEAEQADHPSEILRFWEPARPMVVLGRSSRVADEVNRDACSRLDIPILRRASGGAAIVTGPGCLMYTLVLSYRLRPVLRAVDRAHQFVLGTIARALEPLAPGVRCRGTSDLAIGRLKFSGNSVRIKRDNLLYHGTLLYDFALELVDQCLMMPPRQPDYRHNRPHATFITNLPLPASAIRQSLLTAWDATELQVTGLQVTGSQVNGPRPDWPQERTARLVDEKYGHREWNEQR